MAKHKGRNIRKAKIKKYNNKMLKNERKEMSKRIEDLCPENDRKLNKDIAQYGSNLRGESKSAFNELLNQMESGEIYV